MSGKICDWLLLIVLYLDVLLTSLHHMIPPLDLYLYIHVYSSQGWGQFQVTNFNFELNWPRPWYSGPESIGYGRNS